jgi:hypothetical protein
MPVPALVLEDGTGVPNANTYASAAMFADFAAAHLYADAYTTADDPKRSTALLMATRHINANLEFHGQPVSPGQALDWPRRQNLGPGFAPGGAWPLSYGARYPETSAAPSPRRLQDATCELALALLAFNYVADAESRGISRVSLGQGAVDVTFDPRDRKRPLPEAVEVLLQPFGILRYCRANVSLRRVQ